MQRDDLLAYLEVLRANQADAAADSVNYTGSKDIYGEIIGRNAERFVHMQAAIELAEEMLTGNKRPLSTLRGFTPGETS